MSTELANTIWDAFLIVGYIFGIVPAIGHMLGTSSKRHWVGYDYEPCMGRGLFAHAIIGVACLVLWAIYTKLF